MAEWHYIGHYGQLGPLTFEQIEELVEGGVIVRETYVWRTGLAEWQRADQCVELQTRFLTAPSLSVPPPPPNNAHLMASQPHQPAPPSHLAGRPQLLSDFASIPSNKSKVAAGILNILIPGVGRMYLGYSAIGFIQLAVTICTAGAGWIWPFVDGILMMSGAVSYDGYGRVLKD